MFNSQEKNVEQPACKKKSRRARSKTKWNINAPRQFPLILAGLGRST
jgi:hypothetical protein